MVFLRSTYHLLLMVLLAMWGRGESEDPTCADKGGTCVPEDDNSCSDEVDYPGCNEDEMCCISSASFLSRQSDDGCRIKRQCKNKHGYCIKKGVEKCIGRKKNSWCVGKKCTCCIPKDETCGMLNTDPISADPLDYYNFVIPKPLLSGVTLCPTGSVLVPYDIPSFQSYGSKVKGITCTNNSWVLKQHALGLTNCRMVLQYDTEFPGYDAPNWTAIPLPYHEAMRNCNANSCNGLVCKTSFDFCWLKIKTPAEVGKSPFAHPLLQFWTTVCE